MQSCRSASKFKGVLQVVNLGSRDVDPQQVDSYNELMQIKSAQNSLVAGLGKLFLSFFIVAVLSGCASKSSARLDAPQFNPKNWEATASGEQNPILLEEEFEAEQRGEIPQFDIP